MGPLVAIMKSILMIPSFSSWRAEEFLGNRPRSKYTFFLNLGFVWKIAAKDLMVDDLTLSQDITDRKIRVAR